MAGRDTDDGLPAALGLLPATLLTDQTWLEERIRDVVRGFARRSSPTLSDSDARIGAALWWYSAGLVLLGAPVHELLTRGAVADLRPSALRFTLRPDGYVERVVVPVAETPVWDPSGDAVPEFGRRLDDLFGQVITPLARAGRTTERSLWAIAVDSLATRVLASTLSSASSAASSTPGAPELASAIASAAPRMRPLPRYVDVPLPASTSQDRAQTAGRRYVHRVSCCLLYRVPGGYCTSCPRQTPAERAERLRAHAAAMARPTM